MIKNIFKTAWRSLIKFPVFTSLNIFGLTLGILTCILAFFFISDEYSFDKFNSNYKRIYRVNTDIKYGTSITSHAIAAPIVAVKLKKDFPEIEKTVRILPVIETIKNGNQTFTENSAAYCDADIFQVFTIPFLYGDPKTALTKDYTVVISESYAKKYFNKIQVIGNILTLVGDSGILYNCKITGVMKDIPVNSHFRFELLFPMGFGDASSVESFTAFYPIRTYLLLKANADYRRLESKFPKFVQENLPYYNAITKAGDYIKLSLTPLNDIHLHSNRLDEFGVNSNLQYLNIFLFAALLVMFIACGNYMNLSTANYTNRAREAGIRKVLGATKQGLVFQFLTETFVIIISACIIAVLFSIFLLPWFNEISGKQITASFQTFNWLSLYLIFFAFLLSLLAGLYPAFILSSFNPSKILKSNFSVKLKGIKLRKILVILQFTISIFLIVCTLSIKNQLHYIHFKDLGFDRVNLLVIKNLNPISNQQAIRFKQNIKHLRGVENATLSSFLPLGTRRWENKFYYNNIQFQAQLWPIDVDYISTMGMTIVDGRNFSDLYPTDSNAVVINETAANILGFKYNNSVNQVISYENKMFHIIGILKDFNFNSLRKVVSPTVFIQLNKWSKKEQGDEADNLSIKILPKSSSTVLASIDQLWKESGANRSISYSFMEDDFNAMYKSDERMINIFKFLTFLALVIACIGLFGLASYSTNQRVKEISIRKILGSSVNSIFFLLTKDFIQQILIAILIACPIALITIQKWLEGFVYRTSIDFVQLLLAITSVILIALSTIGLQILKAARLNPVKNINSI
ncbi:MAG TPA: ABC transporter permease [Chitinophagaceae bacterium]|nr:ABC transporter permease [Chitinophagaceae bacterium]